MRYLLLLLLLLTAPVYAGEANLSWVIPTENTDGSPYTNYGGYKLYYGTMTGSVTDNVIVIPDSTAVITTYRITELADGDYQFAITAYNDLGLESELSDRAYKTVVTGTPPLPPELTFSTYETGIYNVVKKANGFVFVYAGSVPLNTPCDVNQHVNGYYAVPVSAVTWTGSVRPIVVVGRCSEH